MFLNEGKHLKREKILYMVGFEPTARADIKLACSVYKKKPRSCKIPNLANTPTNLQSFLDRRKNQRVNVVAIFIPNTLQRTTNGSCV